MASARKSTNAGYRHPRTGQARKSRQPLRIDRLSQQVKDFIISARAAGEPWKRIEELASAAAGVHLPSTSLQRWHDLRVEQREVPAALERIEALLKRILEAVSK